MGDRGSFTDKQREILLQPVKAERVRQDNHGMSYLEGYEVTAHLNRLFGFEGWDKEISYELVFEESAEKNGRLGWWVCYSAKCRLTIFSPDGLLATVKEDAGTGAADNQPSRASAHDLAIKSAVTDAMKRAAKDEGDQFGLSLYRKGSTEALVKRVIPYETPDG